jgi:glycosyltransferase involved in cell wall biosynthesis
MTSYWEGSPNVIKEAMACNIPIVSVDVGDVQDVIGDCPGCYIVKRKSEDFTAKLDFILRTVDRTEGRAFIQHLEIQKVAKKIINIYKKIGLNSNGKYN